MSIHAYAARKRQPAIRRRPGGTAVAVRALRRLVLAVTAITALAAGGLSVSMPAVAAGSAVTAELQSWGTSTHYFSGQFVLRNPSPKASTWKLTFTVPKGQYVNNSDWSVKAEQKGKQVTLSPKNGPLGAGAGEWISFGVQGDGSAELGIGNCSLDGKEVAGCSASAEPDPPASPDTAAPSSPTDLAAETSHDTARITWAAATDNVGVTSYELRDKANSRVATTVAPAVTLAALKPETSYTYSVVALDAAGNVSPNSKPLTLTTLPAPVVPVDDVQAPSVPGSVTAQATGATSIVVKWAASTDNVGVVAYHVLANGAEATPVPGSTLEATLTGLTAETTYAIQVVALDAAGNVSLASPEVSVTTQKPVDANPPDGGSVAGDKVVGYFAEWGVYDRKYFVKNIVTSGSAEKLTHILYSFANTTGGKCTLGDPYADYQQTYTAENSVDGVADDWTAAEAGKAGSFNQLLKLKKQYPHLKVLMSVGGWTWSSGFTDAAANPEAFAASCKQLLDDPRWVGLFDGIDIDWEYPNTCGLYCDASGPDAFNRLITAVRGEFGPGRLVTAATTADGSDGGKIDATDYGAAIDKLDWLMPMTYDYFGGFNATGPTAPHSPLESYDGIPQQGFNSQASFEKMKAQGIPAEKLLLGIGFYGRGWTGVTQSTPGGSASGPAAGLFEPGIQDYKLLKESCPPTGKVGGTSYSHCGNEWWSFDTPETIIDKMAWAKKQGMGGAFFWELSGDTPNGELITAIREGQK